LGNSIGFSLSGVIASSSLEWEGIFYLFGGLGCAWFPIWMIRAYEKPDQHPSITKAELMLIRQGEDDIEDIDQVDIDDICICFLILNATLNQITYNRHRYHHYYYH